MNELADGLVAFVIIFLGLWPIRWLWRGIAQWKLRRRPLHELSKKELTIVLARLQPEAPMRKGVFKDGK